MACQIKLGITHLKLGGSQCRCRFLQGRVGHRPRPLQPFEAVQCPPGVVGVQPGALKRDDRGLVFQCRDERALFDIAPGRYRDRSQPPDDLGGDRRGSGRAHRTDRRDTLDQRLWLGFRSHDPDRIGRTRGRTGISLGVGKANPAPHLGQPGQPDAGSNRKNCSGPEVLRTQDRPSARCPGEV